jgi:hypothetical protein
MLVKKDWFISFLIAFSFADVVEAKGGGVDLAEMQYYFDQCIFFGGGFFF